MPKFKYAQQKIMYRTNGSGFDIEKLYVSDYNASSVYRYETDCEKRKRYNRISNAECGYNWFVTYTDALESLLVNAQSRLEILKTNYESEQALVKMLINLKDKHNRRF